MDKDEEYVLVSIPVGKLYLKGDLVIPDNPLGMVIFSHGSGSSRLSPRNTFVADQLNRRHFATLLFDLLTFEEDSVYENRFDIELLTKRLVEATRWVARQPDLAGLNIGYFGASTGAASALKAAAILGDKIKAVVSRGGRPDLAGASELKKVSAPTLLIIGGHDHAVIELNREAYNHFSGKRSLMIIPGATHLFEEPGTLEEVTRISLEWFKEHLNPKK